MAYGKSPKTAILSHFCLVLRKQISPEKLEFASKDGCTDE